MSHFCLVSGETLGSFKIPANWHDIVWTGESKMNRSSTKPGFGGRGYLIYIYIYYIFIPIYLYIYISISVYMYILYVYLWVYKCAWYFFIHIRYTFILGKIETQNLKPYILKPKVKNTEYNRIASVFVHSQLATNLVCVCYVWMWANVWAGANMDTHTHTIVIIVVFFNYYCCFYCCYCYHYCYYRCYYIYCCNIVVILLLWWWWWWSSSSSSSSSSS